ncbi:hypothetical protein IC582_019907 [Cucumis melo]
MDLLLYHVQNNMLHMKHLCKYSFTILDSSFLESYYSLIFFCIEVKLHNYILTKFFYLFFKTGINKEPIIRQRLYDNRVLTADNKKVKWTDTTTHLTLWSEADLDYYFTSTIGAIQDKVGWGDVNYVIGCINIKEHWLAIAADMKKCKIYVLDSMPKYVEQKLVDAAIAIPTRCIPSLVIAIGIHVQRKRFRYGPWPILR